MLGDYLVICGFVGDRSPAACIGVIRCVDDAHRGVDDQCLRVISRARYVAAPGVSCT